MAVDIRSTANFGAYLKDRCKVIGARIKSDGTQVGSRGGKETRERESFCRKGLVSLSPSPPPTPSPCRARARPHAGSFPRGHGALLRARALPTGEGASEEGEGASERERETAATRQRRRVRARGPASARRGAVGTRAQGLTPLISLPPPSPTNHTKQQQDLYVAVIKATIEEETVPKEKHVRS
jgi:hypothetical protein